MAVSSGKYWVAGSWSCASILQDPSLSVFMAEKSYFETSVLGGSLVNGLTKESNLHRRLGLCCLQGAPSSLIFLIRSLVDTLCHYSSHLFHYRESQKQGNQLFQRELVFFSRQKIWGSGGGGEDYISFGLVYYKIPKESNVPLGTWAQTVCQNYRISFAEWGWKRIVQKRKDLVFRIKLFGEGGLRKLKPGKKARRI